MSIELRRIYLENYKLFDIKSIEFEDYLSVFDGPNGYGKTSIFDAIEFLITGSISRIKESQAISGNLGYSSNFLAKEQNKDVIIKGEFSNNISSEVLVIALLIPTELGKNSRKNNPKNIDSQVETYFLPEYNLPLERWGKYLVDQVTATNKRNDYFGVQNIDFFTMLHYIRQEDRLSYFKRTEAERTVAIENLFGIQSHISKATQIEQTYKQLHNRLRFLDKEVEQLSNDIQNIPADAIHQAEYVSLAGGKPKWDQQNLGFRGSKSNALFEQFVQKIDGIKELYLHREEYYLFNDIKEFLDISDDQRAFAVLAWKILNENPALVSELRKKRGLLDFLTTQQKLIDKSQFTDVDWSQLCNTLDRVSLCDQFLSLATHIKNASSNRIDLQKSLSSLKRAREQLHQNSQSIDFFQNGKCPYCGQEWQDNPELEDHFAKTQFFIDTVLGREFVEYTLAIEQCKGLFIKECKHQFDSMIITLENDIMLQLFSQFPNWQTFENCATKCIPAMNRLGFISEQVELQNTLQDSVQAVSHIVKQIAELKETISAAYFELNQKYRFYELYTESFSTPHALENLSISALDQKREYIVNQYYHSFDESRNQLQTLMEQRKKLYDLCEQMKNYSLAMKSAIKSYQQLVIGQIEIPFFLYSSRLLQSYQGGQGVIIKSDGKTVRFTAPGGEHDVLYTMSSGQLSAVLLAFSLALNKIYAGDSFQTILIDDPIQCMDDINMISFVELLRREFGQSQIILSTHEDTFSNYICYKFQKYGLSQQTITLKDSQ